MRRRNIRVLERIRNADIRVTVPEKTARVQPLLVPGMEVEETRLGVAKVGKREAIYLRVRMRRED